MTWPSDPNRWKEPPPKAPVGRLTPLRVMQIVEIGVIAFRRHWRPLVAGTAVLATIPLLLGDLAQVRLGDVVSADVKFDASGFPLPIPSDLLGEIATAIVLVIATELLSSAFLMLASLLASVYVARDYRGEPTSLSAAFATMLRRSPVALAVWLLTTALSIGVLALAVLVAILAYVVLPPAAGSVGGPGAFIALLAIVGGVVAFAIISIRFLVAPVAAVLEPDGPTRRCVARGTSPVRTRGERSASWRLSRSPSACMVAVVGGVRRVGDRRARERFKRGGGARAGDRNRLAPLHGADPAGDGDGPLLRPARPS